MRDIPSSSLARAVVVLVAGSVICGIGFTSLGRRPKNSEELQMESGTGIGASSETSNGPGRLQRPC